MRRWGCRKLPALSFLGGGEAFDLLEVVDIVASHGFDDGPEGHGAAFGVGGATVAVVLGDGVEEEQVPVAGGLEERHGGFKLVCLVTPGPGVLVEGLDDGVGLIEFGSESLSEAEGKDDFAVRQVGGYFANAPFSWSGAGVDLSVGEAGGEGADARSGGFKNRDRFFALEVDGVRI